MRGAVGRHVTRNTGPLLLPAMRGWASPFGVGLSYCVPSLARASLGPRGLPSLSRARQRRLLRLTPAV